MADNNPELQTGLLPRTAGSVGGAVLGLVGAMIFGPVGALVGSASSPLLADGAERLQVVLRRRMAKIDELAEVAEGISKTSFEELVERAASFDDDRRLEIIGRALQAAALSDYEPSLRALGRALATGALAEDSAKVDESLRIISTLAQLDAIDIKVLDCMAGSSRRWHIHPVENQRQPSLEEAVPEAGLLLDHVLARLSTHGLIVQPMPEGMTFGGVSWNVTDFGQLCLDTMRVAGSD